MRRYPRTMSELQLPSTIVLVGMMGSGKSVVGLALAQRLGCRYVDNDDLVRAVTGRPAERIDAEDGEASLHRAEAEALRHALTMRPPLIIGAAAWVVVDPTSVALLREQPAVVYLRARPETLHTRIGSGAGRRDDATDLAWLQARFSERDATYREIATYSLDTDELDTESITARIEVILAKRAG